MSESLPDLLRRTRRPATYREILAVCLRHIRMGDPFSTEPVKLPATPAELLAEVHTSEHVVSGIRCVLYSPRQQARGLMLYMHGGGFVVGCSEDTDYITRRICSSAGLAVISINYRLAPETMFPGALEDCFKVFEWVHGSESQLGVDTSRIFLAGDSAGGNLAFSLSLKLRNLSYSPNGLVLLAPWLDMNLELYGSYNRLAPDGIVFDAAFMGFARAAYARFEDWQNALCSPMLCDPSKMPPTIVFVGTDDPLLDQSTVFAEIVREASCDQVELITYDNVPHCFYSFPGLYPEELDCWNKVAEFVQKNT